MCGIVGVIGDHKPVNVVVEGLKRLEYRGYDSSGVATLNQGKLELHRAVGKLAALEEKLQGVDLPQSTLAIGHTRWATHGEPNEQNAHPHMADKCAVVHNGIIENFLPLRESLIKEGMAFKSDTDTETLPALITKYMQQGKSEVEATIATMNDIEGAFALGILFDKNSDMLIATRRGAPLVIGIGEGCNYIASDPMALATFTNKFIFLENDDVAILTPEGVKIIDTNMQELTRDVKMLDVSAALTGKGQYRHFMHKEIHEQGDVMSDTLVSFLDSTRENIEFPEMPFDLKAITQVTIIACGTSYYAANVAKYWIEQMAKVAVNIDIASEFRYRQPPLVKGGLCIFISQSGETADTLAALHHVKAAGQHVLSIVNVPNSSIERDSDIVLHTKAGTEIGVASTKAFTTQLTVLALFALKLSTERGALSAAEVTSHLHDMKELPARMGMLPELDKELQTVAGKLRHAVSALYLGRDSMFPIAMEGALKLKEISYIHAEGYAAGEMKHGPIALIDEELPVVVLAPSGRLFEKNISNLQEVEARRGQTILITDKAGAAACTEHADRTVVVLPDMSEFLQPIFYTLPVQLLAYHVAVLKGTDVDQPRNLAKSVTVE